MTEPAVPPRPSQGPRPQDIDPAAVRRQSQRLALAPNPPWLHAEVAQRMAERLGFITLKPQRVLDVTPTLGASRDVLRAAYPKAEWLWHESNPGLAACARRQRALSWWQRLRTAPDGELTSLPAKPAVDLVWSNMALHASSDLPGELAAWQSSLATDGFVMFSCLGPDSFIELRALFTQKGFGRAAPDWWDMHDVGDLMLKAGFADPVMDQERLTLTWETPQRLLADLRALGGNLAQTRFAGLRGRRWAAQLNAALEGLRDASGRLSLSLEVVYGHAFKAAPRLPVAVETRVSVEAMRATLKQGRSSD